MLAQLAGVRGEPLAVHVGVAALHGLQVGRERHLGVDDDLLAAGQVHDHVRPDAAVLAVRR